MTSTGVTALDIAVKPVLVGNFAVHDGEPLNVRPNPSNFVFIYGRGSSTTGKTFAWSHQQCP